MCLCIGLHNYYYVNDVTESWSHALTFRQGHTEISNWPLSIGLVMETTKRSLNGSPSASPSVFSIGSVEGTVQEGGDYIKDWFIYLRQYRRAFQLRSVHWEK